MQVINRSAGTGYDESDRGWGGGSNIHIGAIETGLRSAERQLDAVTVQRPSRDVIILLLLPADRRHSTK